MNELHCSVGVTVGLVYFAIKSYLPDESIFLKSWTIV